MPYVMVPVPEEHVEEAMEAVLRITRLGKLSEWDEASMDEYFRAADEPSKALLSLLARAAVAGKNLTLTAVSDAIELTHREIVGMMRELNGSARDMGRPAIIIHQEVTETLPNGRTRAAAVLSTSSELAHLLQKAERAELADGTGPLDGLG